MRIRIALSLLAAASAVASAQTQPGLTFKVRTQLRNHQVPEKAKPDSVRIRRLEMAAAARASADINTSGDAPQPNGRAGGGNTGVNRIMMMSGQAIKGNHRLDVTGLTFLDGDSKVVGTDPTFDSVYRQATTIKSDAFRIPLRPDASQDIAAIISATKSQRLSVNSAAK